MDFSKQSLDDLFHFYFITTDKSIRAGIEAEIDKRNYSPQEIEKSRSAVISQNLAKVANRKLSNTEFVLIFLMPFKKFIRKKEDFEGQLEEHRDERLIYNIPGIKTAKIMGYVFYALLFLLIFAIWY